MIRFLEFPGQLMLVLMNPWSALTNVPQWPFSYLIYNILVACPMFSPKELGKLIIPSLPQSLRHADILIT